MNFNKLSVFLAILLVSILAIGTVSAESVDDSTLEAVDNAGSIETADDSAIVGEVSVDSNDNSIVKEDSADLVVKEDATGDKIVNDSTYSIYFNDDGTLTDEVSDYDTLIIDSLNGKDLNINKSINIVGNDVGEIINGTITLVDKNAGGSIISGLTFNNSNKNAIVLDNGVSDVEIKKNNISIQVDDSTNSYSIAGIITEGYVSNITIFDNDILITGNLSYVYGIDIMAWDSNYNFAEDNPSNINISNNSIFIASNASSGMAEAIYLDTLKDSVVEYNDIDINVSGENAFAYGIAIGDSAYSNSIMSFYYDEDYDAADMVQSPSNITINGNYLNISSEYMIYGIVADVLGVMDDESDELVSAPKSNIVISDNTLYAGSAKGVFGIALAGVTDSEIVNNQLNITGGSISDVSSPDNLGVGTDAIILKRDKSTGKTDNNISIRNNSINFKDEGSNSTSLINLAGGISDVEIYENDLNLNSSATSSAGILVSGGDSGLVNDISIQDNNMSVIGDAKYMYGIDAYVAPWNYTASGKSTPINKIYIDGNNILVNGSNMVEGIYFEAENSSISENNISVCTNGSSKAYGIGTSNVNNLSIDSNNLLVYSNKTSYGMNLYNSEEVNINENNIVALGSTAYAIRSYGNVNESLNANITDNSIMVVGSSSTGISVAGNGTVNIENNDFDVSNPYIDLSDAGENSTVYNNSVPVILVDDNSYSDYFDDNGNLNGVFTSIGTIIVGELNNKSFIINIPTNIVGNGDGEFKINNGTITLTADASGSNISSLNFNYEDDVGISDAIINLEPGIANVTISDSVILFNSTKGSSGYNSAMGIKVVGGSDGISENISIINNTIIIEGDAPYIYAIDAYSNPWNYNGTAINDLEVVNNTILIKGTNLVEAAYLSKIGNSLFENNTIVASTNGTSSGADAYGFGTSSSSNLTFNNNYIYVSGNMMSYGLSLSTTENATVSDNKINANGTGAIGVGVAGNTDGNLNANITHNRINTTGGDYSNISTYDATGTGNTPIKVTSNATAIIDDNILISNSGEYCNIDNASENTTIGINYLSTNTAAGKKGVKLVFSDMTTKVVLNGKRNGEWFNVTLTDEAGNPLANKTLKIGFNGKVYNKTTDENGKAKLQINIGYQSANTFSITFLGDDEYEGTVDCAIIVVKTLTTKLTVTSPSYKAAAKTKTLKATLKYGSTALSGKKITFKVNGQYYIATTNSKGVATVKVSLSTKKTYSYTASFAGDYQYTAITKTGKVTIK